MANRFLKIAGPSLWSSSLFFRLLPPQETHLRLHLRSVQKDFSLFRFDSKIHFHNLSPLSVTPSLIVSTSRKSNDWIRLLSFTFLTRAQTTMSDQRRTMELDGNLTTTKHLASMNASVFGTSFRFLDQKSGFRHLHCSYGRILELQCFNASMLQCFKFLLTRGPRWVSFNLPL